MRRPVLLLSLGLAVAASACGRSTAPAEQAEFGEGAIGATRVAGGIELYNGTNVVIAYQISNRGWLGLLASCSDSGVTCATLAQGARRVVPLSEINGANAGAFSEARISYWSVLQGVTQVGASELLVTM